MAKKRSQGRQNHSPHTGKWYKPNAVPPTIKEQKWKHLRLKTNLTGAGDSGSVEVFTPKYLRELVTTQTRAPQPDEGEVMMIRLHRVAAYALPGVASGATTAQSYPSVKLYVYDLTRALLQSINSWSMDTREATGTLSGPARIGYEWPQSMQVVPMVSVDANNGELFKAEIYHSSRGLVFTDISYSYTDE